MWGGPAGWAGEGGVGGEEAVELVGGDLLAAAADDVLQPAVDGKVALAVKGEHGRQVARAVEAVRGERDGVVLGGVEVARDCVRSAATQLPGGAVGKVLLGARLENSHLIQLRQSTTDST